jgi:hypothetical protein
MKGNGRWEWTERGLGAKMSSREFKEFARICETGCWKVLGSGNNNWTERIWEEDSIIRNLAGFRKFVEFEKLAELAEFEELAELAELAKFGEFKDLAELAKSRGSELEGNLRNWEGSLRKGWER